MLQLARTAPLTIKGVASVSINVSELTGSVFFLSWACRSFRRNPFDLRCFPCGRAFTPEFESVFSGSKPNLPPDPELIAALNGVFGVVAVVAWSGVFVEGFDRLTAPDA